MQTKDQRTKLIIAAVIMATGVTPVDQEMAAEQSNEVKLAKPPTQGLSQDHPGPEVHDSSIINQEAAALKKANSIKEEHFETEERDFGVIDKLRQLTKLPGFGVLLAILCVLWGQVFSIIHIAILSVCFGTRIVFLLNYLILHILNI